MSRFWCMFVCLSSPVVTCVSELWYFMGFLIDFSEIWNLLIVVLYVWEMIRAEMYVCTRLTYRFQDIFSMYIKTYAQQDLARWSFFLWGHRQHLDKKSWTSTWQQGSTFYRTCSVEGGEENMKHSIMPHPVVSASNVTGH